MSDDKVVPIRKAMTGESVQAQLERLAKHVEQLAAHPAEKGYKADTGFAVILCENGRMEVHQLGEKVDDLQCLGLIKIAEQIIIDEIMGA